MTPPSSPSKAAHPPTAPYQRIDTLAIKQRLHNALGPNGLPYWTALVGFLTGKLARAELDGLVDGWLARGEGDAQRLIPLHNQLIIALISNASNGATSALPSAPNSANKRPRPDDPTPYGAKRRVLGWVLGLPRRERERILRLSAGEESDDDAAHGAEDDERHRARRKSGAGWIGGVELSRERIGVAEASAKGAEVAGARAKTEPSTPTAAAAAAASNQILHPVPTAVDSRYLPSHDQVRDRIARAASTESGLEGGAGAGTGRYLGLGLESHVRSLLTSQLQLHRSNLHQTPTVHSSAAPPPLSLKSSAFTPPPASPKSHAAAPPSPALSTSSSMHTAASTSSVATPSASAYPPTPPSHLSLPRLAGLFTRAPDAVLPRGALVRRVGAGLMLDDDISVDSFSDDDDDDDADDEDDPMDGGSGEGGAKDDAAAASAKRRTCRRDALDEARHDDDGGWRGIWRDQERERRSYGGLRLIGAPGEEFVLPGAKEGAGEETGESKEKKKEHAYDYVDPRAILDSILG